jgi:hypothetical protein
MRSSPHDRSWTGEVRTGGDVADLPILLEKLGADGVDEIRRLIADEVARRLRAATPPPTRPSTPGPDEDLRPRS